MDWKEAIEYCNELMEKQFDEFGDHEIALEGVRDLLKRGKAYEEMWEYTKNHALSGIGDDVMENMEKKYKKYLEGK